MYPELDDYLHRAAQVQIPLERRELLLPLAEFVREALSLGRSADLVFICTHNSRRSQFAQVWAEVAAYYHGFSDVHCFSGGTETTAFFPRAVAALGEAGLRISQEGWDNPRYQLAYSSQAAPVLAFSKRFDDQANPSSGFVAVMTCSDADQACPQVSGASKRVSLPYDDPKLADGTAAEEQRYAERCQQICTEMLFVFDAVKQEL